ncbi:MAG: hypothetical protein KGS72_14115 [Cyanobacteria bacterium REEB67]|nr:hypothetical protein [Cyanobacteria bacterium REEB67]
MANNSGDAVSQTVSDFNQRRAGDDFSAAASDLVALKASDMTHFKDNLDQINQQVDFKKLGFSEDFTILNSHADEMETQTQDGQLQVRKTSDLNNIEAVGHPAQAPSTVAAPPEGTIKEAAPSSTAPASADSTAPADSATAVAGQEARPAIEAIGTHGRTLSVMPDGSASYTAQANNGDCYWRVAADVLSTRTGQQPSDADVSNFVDVLAKYNNKTNPDELAVDEKIMIPPPAKVDAAAPDTQATPATQAGDASTTAQAADTTQTPQRGDTTVAPQTGDTSLAQQSGDAAALAQPDQTIPTRQNQFLATTDNVPATIVSPGDGTPLATQPTVDESNAAATTTDVTSQVVSPATIDSQSVAPVAPAALLPEVEALKPQSGIYNVIAPPAQGLGQFGETWSDARDMAASRNNETEADLADGTKTDTYSGYLQDGIINNWFAASYAAEETVNANGGLEHRKIDYSSGGFGLPSVSFQTPGHGNTSIDQVQSVETTRDDGSGQYATTIIDGSGEQWRAISGADGQTLSFDPVVAASP